MRNIILSFCFILQIINCNAQITDSLNIESTLVDSKTNITAKHIFNFDVALLDTLFNYTKNVPMPETYSWSKNMPWIGAIIIGILTFLGNLIVSHYTRKSNKTVALKQIENSRIIAEQQMQLLKTNSERDFKKTIISGSIQLWISDFRNIISEILSTIEIVRFNEVLNDDSIKKIHFLLSKCEIMLGSLSYDLLANKLKELKEICLEIPTGNKQFYHLDELITQIRMESLLVLSEQSELAQKLE